MWYSSLVQHLYGVYHHNYRSEIPNEDAVRETCARLAQYCIIGSSVVTHAQPLVPKICFSAKDFLLATHFDNLSFAQAEIIIWIKCPASVHPSGVNIWMAQI